MTHYVPDYYIHTAQQFNCSECNFPSLFNSKSRHLVIIKSFTIVNTQRKKSLKGNEKLTSLNCLKIIIRIFEEKKRSYSVSSRNTKKRLRLRETVLLYFRTKCVFQKFLQNLDDIMLWSCRLHQKISTLE